MSWAEKRGEIGGRGDGVFVEEVEVGDDELFRPGFRGSIPRYDDLLRLRGPSW
jgi:hypothetical protein